MRLNAVCPYYTMFPISFPLEQLKLYPGATRVLDPFCGRGTTIYAARLVGVPAVGVDVNPVAVAIARAKLAKASLASVVGLARTLLSETAGEVPQGEFWQWCFHSDTLQEIVTLRHKLLAFKDTPASELLRAVILGGLHGPRNVGEPSYLSNQMPRTYASKPDYAVKFWQARDLSTRESRYHCRNPQESRAAIERAAPQSGGSRNFGRCHYEHCADAIKVRSRS